MKDRIMRERCALWWRAYFAAMTPRYVASQPNGELIDVTAAYAADLALRRADEMPREKWEPPQVIDKYPPGGEA